MNGMKGLKQLNIGETIMIIMQQRFYRLDIQNNRWMTYVFGDNDLRDGHGGQARACRGELNTIGIRTKKEPNNLKGSFYKDKEFTKNVAKIDEDIDAVQELLETGHMIVFPNKGFGTGMALLRVNAPKTFIHLNNRIRDLLLKYRVPEVTEGIEVRAFKPTHQKMVPFAISINSFERSLATVNKMLAGVDVEDIDPRITKRLVRDLYSTLNDMDKKDISCPGIKRRG